MTYLQTLKFMIENEAINNVDIDPDLTSKAFENTYSKFDLEGAGFHLLDGFYLGDESEESANEWAIKAGLTDWLELSSEMDAYFKNQMELLANEIICNTSFKPFEVFVNGNVEIYAYEDDEDKVKETYEDYCTQIAEGISEYEGLRCFETQDRGYDETQFRDITGVTDDIEDFEENAEFGQKALIDGTVFYKVYDEKSKNAYTVYYLEGVLKTV